MESIEQAAADPILDVQVLREGQRQRLARKPPGRQLYDIKDVTVPGQVNDVSVRLYSPFQGRSLPLLMYFHGGGFSIGNIAGHDALCRELAYVLGWTVASVEYRLAPEHPFPAGVEDCYLATAWLAERHSVFGVDPDRIAVGGDSSGGTFATVVAMMCRDNLGPKISKQLLICPNTEDHRAGQRELLRGDDSFVQFARGYLMDSSALEQFLNWYLPNQDDRTQAYAIPMRSADLSNLPSALVLTAECDPLRDEGERYAARLSAAGVPVMAYRVAGTIHGFMTLFGDDTDGTEGMSVINKFLNGEH
ncbi:MAG: alpha/beta hydrolase [Thermaerobacter sp.]|nr:alpha/beta hydrolase [Thermaerobacter sp.]